MGTRHTASQVDEEIQAGERPKTSNERCLLACHSATTVLKLIMMLTPSPTGIEHHAKLTENFSELTF